MNTTRVTLLGAALALCAACDPGSIPNRNVNDVTFEVRELNDTTHQVVVDNPNAVRVGAEFKLRIYREGQRPPIDERIEHIYVAASIEDTIDVDLSSLCDPDAAPFEADANAQEAAPSPAEGAAADPGTAADNEYKPEEHATAPSEAAAGPDEGTAAADQEAARPAGTPACSDLRVHATLLQTYWIADE